jgi:hypothetical protein
MTEAEVLAHVKAMLGVSGSALDSTLTGYIYEVKRYCKSAGVPDALLNSLECVGVISRGVADLWNYGAGGVDFSPVFYNIVSQLRLEAVDNV